MEENSQKNPKRNDTLVEKRHDEICNLLESHREEIESGKLIVYVIDECHLLWGDVCGYGWGTTKERLEIPMTNERDRRSAKADGGASSDVLRSFKLSNERVFCQRI